MPVTSNFFPRPERMAFASKGIATLREAVEHRHKPCVRTRTMASLRSSLRTGQPWSPQSSRLPAGRAYRNTRPRTTHTHLERIFRKPVVEAGYSRHEALAGRTPSTEDHASHRAQTHTVRTNLRQRAVRHSAFPLVFLLLDVLQSWLLSEFRRALLTTGPPCLCALSG
jgi:hypothetical protein